jgi:hypothetical protein
MAAGAVEVVDMARSFPTASALSADRASLRPRHRQRQARETAEKHQAVIPGRAKGAIPEFITPVFRNNLDWGLWIPALLRLKAGVGRNDSGEFSAAC